VAFLASIPRIPAQGSFFATLHQYAGVGVAAAMIALEVLYHSISRARVAEGTPFFVHVGLPCAIAEMLFGRFSRSIPNGAAHEAPWRCRRYRDTPRVWRTTLGNERRTARCRPALHPRPLLPRTLSGISEPPMAFAEPNIPRTDTRVRFSCPGSDGLGGLRNMDISPRLDSLRRTYR